MFFLSVSENILLFVSGFGIMQAIFSACLLIFYPKSDRSVNSFLALYICALTLPVILPVAQHIFSWQVMIFLEPFLTLIGPFLYFYVRSFKEVITLKKAWPHLTFFIICIPLAWWNYSAIGSRFPAAHSVPPEAARHVLFFLPISLRLVQRVIYYFLSRRELLIYQRSILHLFSDTSRINLNWVKWLINGFLFLIITTVVFYPLMLRYPQYFDWWVLIPGVIVSLYIYAATFRGITQPTLWQINSHVNKEKLEEELNTAGQIEVQVTSNEKAKYQKTSISNNKINEITSRIRTAMEDQKLFSETELTLQDLSDKLQFPSYQVSQAINEGLKKSFYDLINSYRVEEAKRLLVDPKNKNYTILSVGFEAGFNSKTTFNTVFKKFTGLTPTEFRDREKANKQQAISN